MRFKTRITLIINHSIRSTYIQKGRYILEFQAVAKDYLKMKSYTNHYKQGGKIGRRIYYRRKRRRIAVHMCWPNVKKKKKRMGVELMSSNSGHHRNKQKKKTKNQRLEDRVMSYNVDANKNVIFITYTHCKSRWYCGMLAGWLAGWILHMHFSQSVL